MKKNNKKGFTLVELVIVVAVMAILVAVAIPVVGNITSSAQDSVNKSNAQTIESVIKLAEAKVSNGEDSTATTTLSVSDIKSALEGAKLGITEGNFMYDSSTGAVTVSTSSATASGTNQFKIVFATASGGATTITVTQGS